MSTAAWKRYTPEEYLARERAAEHKSEYLDGAIYAMSGASREHGRIAANLATEIGPRLNGGPCEYFISEMRVLIPATGLYTYPDLVVVCGEPQFQDDQVDTLLNPTLIVEILSPSTEKYDRGKKFEHYRTIASLREYVLVSQDRVLVERFFLREGRWDRTDVGRLDGNIRLESIGCDIPVRKVYARVVLPEPGMGQA